MNNDTLIKVSERMMNLMKTFTEKLREMNDFREEMESCGGNKGEQFEEQWDDRRYVIINYFVSLKKWNRDERVRFRDEKERLQNKKLSVDSERLQLQNLIYERDQIKNDIKRCYNFKSQDEELDLLPVEKYLPFLKLEKEPEEGHDKRIVQLEGELAVRKKLADELQALLKLRGVTTTDIADKEKQLESFKPALQTLMDAALPVQNALNAPNANAWEIHRFANLLPPPLYIAYMNIYSFERISELNFNLSIIGTDADISEYELSKETVLQNKTERLNIIRSDDDDSNSAKPIVPDELAKSADYKSLLVPHPLHIRVCPNWADKTEDNIYVDIYYLPKLNLITALSLIKQNEELVPLKNVSGTAYDLLQFAFDNDLGDAIPPSKAFFMLEKTGIDEAKLLSDLGTANLGKPYKWAQKLCGLFTKYTFSTNSFHRVMKFQKFVPEVLHNINNVWNARLNLLRQTKAIANNTYTQLLHIEDMPKIEPSCSFVQLSNITWEEFQENASTKCYRDEGLIDKYCTFYRVVLVRGSAKMECLIGVPKKFPGQSPVWAISVHWNGEHTSLNNTGIKMMEQRINTLLSSDFKGKHSFLPGQLLSVMHCFDVFLETESPLNSAAEFPKSKHYINSYSKRIRQRPYRYYKDGSGNTFIP